MHTFVFIEVKAVIFLTENIRKNAEQPQLKKQQRIGLQQPGIKTEAIRAEM